ncbi:MAG TPA: hybrid sensor histidine kinase/response regulator [Verrucomicrobiae bacterium]|nr:hybrid sensor histidine kinase/response regulator [Verrucomicrobiae bacterium]
MNPELSDNLGGLSMLELFRAEAETQTGILTNGLLELERGAAHAETFETLMRAAHSLKGAARIVNQQLSVRVAHALEDCFVAAQKSRSPLTQDEMDLVLGGVDLLADLAKRTEDASPGWEADALAEVEAMLTSLAVVAAGGRSRGARVSKTAPGSDGTEASSRTSPATSSAAAMPQNSTAPGAVPWSAPTEGLIRQRNEAPERTLRLAAESLNRLLGLAGESLVESRWLRPFADSFQRLKRDQMEVSQKLESLRRAVGEEHLSPNAKAAFNELFRQTAYSQQFVQERMQELEMYDRRTSQLAQRLYLEVLRTRMRPLSDGVRRFPRMVRDLSQALGKSVRLEITGETTQVDRDILERLETPVAHLLRNAVDHGCEPPSVRERLGKAPEATLKLEARHSAGVLLVAVSDDGAGVDTELVRAALVEKRLASAAVASKLTESELLEFLFLPGFSLKETVTEISGRGFGLDVVQNMVKGVRGSIRLHNQPGRGLRVQLQLPLTLSVVRALLVEVGGEPYAIPLNQINRTLRLPRHAVETLEGQPHFHLAGQQVGLLTAHQVLECGRLTPNTHDLAVVVLNDRSARYGLVVDQFLGERELVVQALDPRLGAIRDISASALMEDGTPVLILDVEGVIRSIERLRAEGRLGRLALAQLPGAAPQPKRILAVDDSLTVRELERKLLTSRGYVTDVAVDGLEAWNAVQSGLYSLVITDVDMPQVDGIQLARLIKADARLQSLPVLILSYKDQDRERLQGLEAGAEYYLTKGGFEDESLLQAVIDLIGEPELES